MKLNRTPNPLDRSARNMENENWDKIEGTIVKVDEAVDNTVKALDKAEDALGISQNTQNQLNTIVINGDSSVEAAQARVDKDNHQYNTLKDRLDAEQEALDEIKSRKIGVRNIATNKPTNWEQGSINASTGEGSGTSSTWIRTKELSSINSGEHITISKNTEYNLYIYLYDENESFIDFLQVGYVDTRTFEIPNNAHYFKLGSRNREGSAVSVNEIGNTLLIKIEYGTVATGWLPNLDDIESEIDELRSGESIVVSKKEPESASIWFEVVE